MMLDHPTADEIYDYLHSNYPSISKATVYRILSRMTDEGEILRLHIPGGPDKFDTTVSEHHHIKCTSCGKLCDIDFPELHSICSKIENTCGFSVTGCSLFFDGVCPECVKKESNY